jgi:hypothetical protein
LVRTGIVKGEIEAQVKVEEILNLVLVRLMVEVLKFGGLEL